MENFKIIDNRRDATRVQPAQLDSIRISDGTRRYSFLLNRLGGYYRLYIPDKNPNKFHSKVIYRFKARHIFLDKLHPFVDTVFRLNEALACTPFNFEGDRYRQYIDICTEHPEDLVIADVITELTCIEYNRSGEIVQDPRFDPATGSYIHYEVPFSTGCEQNRMAWGTQHDLWIRLGDTIQVEPSLFYHPASYSSTIGQELYQFTTRCSIYLATDSDVLWEKHDNSDLEMYEFNMDFPLIYDDSLKLVVTITYYKDNISYLVQRQMLPVPPERMQQLKSKKVNLPDVLVYSPKILNVETPKTPDYKLQTKYITKPLFFRTHPSASILLHSGVNENIAINLDTYKSQVRYFTIKVGTNIFKEIARNDKGVIFKILGNMIEAGEGTYHILNQDNELVTSGPYRVI